MMVWRRLLPALFCVGFFASHAAAETGRFQTFALPAGDYPAAVAPGPGGTIYYADPRKGALGILDPATGKVEKVPLGSGSSPYGVIVGPENSVWLADSGQNAVVRYVPATKTLTAFRLPTDTGFINVLGAAFDRNGDLWFTGQTGVYAKWNRMTEFVTAWSSPRGRGPHGIVATRNGDVYYASMEGGFLGRVDLDWGETTELEPPTKGQAARGVAVDSKDRIWVSEWIAGKVAVYDPEARTWREWNLPGRNSRPYAIHVDERDIVWLSDWGANALVRFDPAAEKFEVIPFARKDAHVRQIASRPGELLLPETGPRVISIFKR
jgi:virginiamycin B lyase